MDNLPGRILYGAQEIFTAGKKSYTCAALLGLFPETYRKKISGVLPGLFSIEVPTLKDFTSIPLAD